MPKISVIVPVYNAGAYINNTILNVLNQTYTDWELILVDDCSKDDSVSLIKDYLDKDNRIRLIELNNNGGAANARNVGVASSRGRYIAFLDADDVWLPDKLQEELSFMEREDIAFAYTSYEFGDKDAVGTGRVVRAIPQLDYRKALSRTIIFTSTVMFDTEKIPKELINMPKIASEDTATWWKILRNGYIAYGLDKVLSIYRRPDSSLSSNKLVAINRIWNLYRKQEGLSVFSGFTYFCRWAIRATLRRI